MFIPAYFRNTDLSKIKSFIRENGFAILITSGDSIEATHIPIELIDDNGKLFLEGHISKANPQWKYFTTGKNALVIFQGPHAYVSSGWYNHANVPTWNYIAVHVSGKISVMSENDLYNSLKHLVDKYEEGMKNPVHMEEMPEEMLNKNLKGIVGFRIEAEKIEGKWKMSQNRDDEDYQNIIRELEMIEDINSHLVADEMKRLHEKK